MSFGRKKSSPTVEPAKVEFSPKSFELSPFGKYEYSNGGFTTKPSAAEEKGITLRQQLINELLPEIGKPSDARASQINQYGDLFTQKILEQAIPMFAGDQYKRGLAGSTSYNRGYEQLLTDAIEKGLFAREDLYNNDLNNQINAGNFLEGGLQNAFNRLLSISQQGKSNNDQYFAVQESNANRQQAANQFNAQNQIATNNAKTSAFGDIAALAGTSAFGGGGFGGQQTAGTTLSKTGSGGSSGGGGSGGGAGDFFKDPNTWIQLAQIAAMAAGACHVASEIFGGWHHPKTVAARMYMNRIAAAPLREMYTRWSAGVAKVVRDNPKMKEQLRPIFEEFAELGARYMEAGYASN